MPLIAHYFSLSSLVFVPFSPLRHPSERSEVKGSSNFFIILRLAQKSKTTSFSHPSGYSSSRRPFEHSEGKKATKNYLSTQKKHVRKLLG